MLQPFFQFPKTFVFETVPVSSTFDYDGLSGSYKEGLTFTLAIGAETSREPISNIISAGETPTYRKSGTLIFHSFARWNIKNKLKQQQEQKSICCNILIMQHDRKCEFFLFFKIIIMSLSQQQRYRK